jgi:two-component system, OmpR family, sensor kinase
MTSIRRQLLLGLLAVVLIAGLIAAWGVYRRAHDELDEVFDYHLKQMALSLRDQSFEPFAGGLLGIEEGFDFAIQVWSEDGIRMYFSRPHTGLPNRARLGYETVETSEGDWRVFSIQQRGLTLQVAQPMAIRKRLAAAAALRTLAPFLFLLPVLGVLVWVIVGRGLKPLVSVAGAVKARTPAALHPLPERGLPEEIQPLVTALNDLLARLERTLGAQRQFVADAAHELRTPLTALRLQVQLAERAREPDERAAAFATLKQGLERATHLVEQLLTLARQEPEAARELPGPIELGDLMREVVAGLEPLAVTKSIDLGVTRDEAGTIQGARDGLRTLLGNLVDNAVRYTPAGGRVDVAAYREGGSAVLEVIDTGPGIPPDERDRVLDRFYRRVGSEAGGSGLGLSIVRNVAERHGARLALDAGPAGKGLAVRVVFPHAAGH